MRGDQSETGVPGDSGRSAVGPPVMVPVTLVLGLLCVYRASPSSPYQAWPAVLGVGACVVGACLAAYRATTKRPRDLGPAAAFGLALAGYWCVLIVGAGIGNAIWP